MAAQEADAYGTQQSKPGDITRESHDSLETAAKKLRRLLRRHYDDIILPALLWQRRVATDTDIRTVL
ncbi:hypothetical protein OUZ56_030241 [Daphnia magna]|uniref:Uncharacterized protein n=1 Tax=Daphnia magna TaxID=35525 RepID=A0ABQ9ZQQ4_9CRUS|nr:hypothetical protein OUZ56_030241 [Daphnia magna]